MDEVRRRLARARTEAVARLAALGIVPWTIPRGGFYLWCRLPEGLDSAAIARRCMEHRIVLAPGNVFSVSQSAAPFLRFNVAQMSDSRVFSVLEQAMKQSAVS
jgi:DNA-binding transcriptional MocR family regulator